MTQQYIDVIQAHMRGEKIEYRHAEPEDETHNEWSPPAFLTWNFAKYEYRIAPPEPKLPDTIDWSHVAPQYKFMARDNDAAFAWLYSQKPNISIDTWRIREGDAISAIGFFSYKRGNMAWQDSLVERPQP